MKLYQFWGELSL